MGFHPNPNPNPIQPHPNPIQLLPAPSDPIQRQTIPTQPKSRNISLVNPISIQGLPPCNVFPDTFLHFPDPSFPSNPPSIVQSLYLLHQSLTCYRLIIRLFTFFEFRIQILSQI